MVLTFIKNSLQYQRPLLDSFMTFLVEHIIFWYCNMKKSKTSNHKKIYAKPKIYMQNQKYLFPFLKMAIWFYFSENGPFTKFQSVCFAFYRKELVLLNLKSRYTIYTSELFLKSK